MTAESFDADEFRAEVRAFCREHYPADLARKAAPRRGLRIGLLGRMDVPGEECRGDTGRN